MLNNRVYNEQIVINRIQVEQSIIHNFVFKAPTYYKDAITTAEAIMDLARIMGLKRESPKILNTNKNGYSIWSMAVFGDSKKIEKFIIEASRVEDAI